MKRMEVVNMRDAKSNFAKLVKRAAAGEDILIAKNGTPVAMLTRLPPKHRKMPFGIFEGKIHMADDFDEPLDEFKDYM
jgi:antitoxin (DNA-binding transcriptional repressor) of toxin-antitoxin stability system